LVIKSPHYESHLLVRNKKDEPTSGWQAATGSV
jgi:hypothetical protein